MRILLLNPNSSEDITQKIKKAAQKYIGNGVEIEVATTAHGPAFIETAYDEMVAAKESLKELKKREESYDAAVICCFADPGLTEAKECLKKPVVGMLEASVLAASLFSSRLSIISSCDWKSISFFIRKISSYGMQQKLASVRYIDTGVLGVTEEAIEKLKKQIEKCIYKDGAGAVLLGCAAFSNMSADLSKEFGIFVTDGIGPSIGIAKMMIEYQIIEGGNQSV